MGLGLSKWVQFFAPCVIFIALEDDMCLIGLRLVALFSNWTRQRESREAYCNAVCRLTMSFVVCGKMFSKSTSNWKLDKIKVTLPFATGRFPLLRKLLTKQLCQNGKEVSDKMIVLAKIATKSYAIYSYQPSVQLIFYFLVFIFTGRFAERHPIPTSHGLNFSWCHVFFETISKCCFCHAPMGWCRQRKIRNLLLVLVSCCS